MANTTEQNRYAFPAYRVFIFGVEVTDDVVSINTTMNDAGMPNQCQVTLLNEFDKYIITTQDMLALSKIDPAKFKIPWMDETDDGHSDALPYAQPDVSDPAALAQFRDLINKNIFQERKRKILDRKVAVMQSVGLDDRMDMFGRPIISGKYTDYYNTSVRRYPLADGSPIFHAMDPIRVFERDPFNPTRWYWAFSGFLSDTVDSVDQNNAKTLMIVGEDPTKLFRYSRVFVNPGIVDAKTVITDHDLAVQSFYQSFMRGFTLPEVFFTLMFGPDMVGAIDRFKEPTHGPQANSSIRTRLRGIGHFAFDTSAICTFGPRPERQIEKDENEGPKTELSAKKRTVDLGNSLKSWQLLLDHEVQPSDLWMMATQDDREDRATEITLKRPSGLRRDADGKILVEDVITYIGEHPEEYLIDGGRLMMLIPNSLGVENNNVLIKDIIQAYPLQSEWASAGQIMMEVVERIQFSMYCTPRGDIVVEPPLYDFDPDDFGLKKMSSDEVISATSAYEHLARAEFNFPGGDRGPYGTSYIIKKNDTFGWEAATVDEKVYTLASVKKAIFYNMENLPYSDIVGDLEVVRLVDLIPLYGVRPAPVTARGYVHSPEGAQLYANITLNRLNADAHTMHIMHVPNIKMWINRPIYVQGRNCIGTTKGVTQSITWGQQGSMETTSDLYALRTWSGQVDKDNRPIYTAIGGHGSRPLDYAMLMKHRKPPTKNGNIPGIADDIPGISGIRGRG